MLNRAALAAGVAAVIAASCAEGLLAGEGPGAVALVSSTRTSVRGDVVTIQYSITPEPPAAPAEKPRGPQTPAREPRAEAPTAGENAPKVEAGDEAPAAPGGAPAGRPRLDGGGMLFEMLFALADAAVRAPSSREVVLVASVGECEVAAVSAPTEELWAAGTGAGKPEEVLGHVSAEFVSAAAGREVTRAGVERVRSALADAGLEEFTVRAERGSLIVRIEHRPRAEGSGELALWLQIIGLAAGSTPGAEAYVVEAASGPLVVTRVVLAGRDASALAEGALSAAEAADRLQVCY